MLLVINWCLLKDTCIFWWWVKSFCLSRSLVMDRDWTVFASFIIPSLSSPVLLQYRLPVLILPLFPSSGGAFLLLSWPPFPLFLLDYRNYYSWVLGLWFSLSTSLRALDSGSIDMGQAPTQLLEVTLLHRKYCEACTRQQEQETLRNSGQGVWGVLETQALILNRVVWKLYPNCRC